MRNLRNFSVFGNVVTQFDLLSVCSLNCWFRHIIRGYSIGGAAVCLSCVFVCAVNV